MGTDYIQAVSLDGVKASYISLRPMKNIRNFSICGANGQ